MGLIHARAKTKGDAKDNVNNHPVIGLGWVVVHNGNVSNDDDLFEYYKTERFADVDTAAIPLVLAQAKTDEAREIIEKITILDGSATFAAWSLKNPQQMLLGRLGFNDIYLFLDTTSNMLMFSSAASFARYLPAFNIGGLRFLTLSRLEDERVVLLDRDYTKNRTFKVKRSPFGLIRPKIQHGGSPGAEARKAVKGADGKVLLATITENDRVYTCAWIQSGDTKKPRPDMGHAAPEPIFIQGAYPIKPASARKIHTPYGSWSFYRSSDNKTSKTFRPRRSVRKWWSRQFSQSIFLPWSGPKLDNSLPFEAYNVKVAANSGAEVHVPGYMCPWCGIMNRAAIWDKYLKWRCEFCGIASRMPAQESV